MEVLYTFKGVNSDEFTATIRGEWGVIAEIPLNVPFNVYDYMAKSEWAPLTRITIAPIGESEILAIESKPTGLTIAPSEWGNTWTVLIPNVADTTNYDINVIFPAVDGVNIVPYNKAYLVDSEIVTEFSQIPNITIGGEFNTGTDISQYIINLLNVPFKIPDTSLDIETDIILGSVNTKVKAPLVATDLLTLDLGSIEVLGLTDNSTDYLSTKYDLILPFLPDVIELEAEWVINKTISVEYVLDVYLGDVTVNIYNGDEFPITTIKSSIGRSIPLKTHDSINTEIGNIQGVENRVNKAYIRKSTDVLQEGIFSNLVSDENTINSFTGYIEVENIELTGKVKLYDRQKIINLLSNGVIIK